MVWDNEDLGQTSLAPVVACASCLDNVAFAMMLISNQIKDTVFNRQLDPGFLRSKIYRYPCLGTPCAQVCVLVENAMVDAAATGALRGYIHISSKFDFLLGQNQKSETTNLPVLSQA